MSASDKPTRAQIQNPSTHYGKAKASTRHFITQRITGAINIVFALFIIWFVVSLAGRAPAEMIELARNPFVAIGLALLVVNVSIHMRNGMRDVIEDYFDKGEHGLAMLANNLFVASFFVVALGAIAKLVFWG
ncbi:succinate dehydrogenase, hydrophobic membrane anchor protein [Devosia sp. A16]|uniref:succinate dehydrogenase, hydrophobic membrane anchor protein n=1 Tax=Devosia sp. A16 TaxID=1736675 RepID=UPI0006D7D127|nr:succinate dehydrogenase, hydrophobic membrane anchor protein [Devosia sp. A16]